MSLCRVLFLATPLVSVVAEVALGVRVVVVRSQTAWSFRTPSRYWLPLLSLSSPAIDTESWALGSTNINSVNGFDVGCYYL